MSKSHQLEYHQIAAAQIDKAVDCFTENTLKGYICATTLAGAAEEVLGKLLNYQRNIKSILEETVIQILANHQITEEHDDFKRLKKNFITILNHPRDAYKHFNVGHCEKDFDPYLYAEMMLNRAIINYSNLRNKITPKICLLYTSPSPRD